METTTLKEFRKTLNARERAAFNNFYHAAHGIIGGFEIEIEDGVREEMPDATEIEALVYSEGLSAVYGPGVVRYDESAKKAVEQFKFCGKERLNELVKTAIYFSMTV